jgi:hypothetical protein
VRVRSPDSRPPIRRRQTPARAYADCRWPSFGRRTARQVLQQVTAAGHDAGVHHVIRGICPSVAWRWHTAGERAVGRRPPQPVVGPDLDPRRNTVPMSPARSSALSSRIGRCQRRFSCTSSLVPARRCAASMSSAYRYSTPAASGRLPTHHTPLRAAQSAHDCRRRRRCRRSRPARDGAAPRRRRRRREC